MDQWRRYLFASHSEGTLREWATRLHRFRFLRAFGGQANDSDRLLMVFRFSSLTDLGGFFEFLGIDPVVHKIRPPQPEPGRSYRPGEWLPSLIPDTKWMEQPGSRKISGQRVFIWCTRDEISISVGSDDGVTEADVDAAVVVEGALVGAALEPVDPPIDSKYCICPKYYPEYFA